VAAITTMTWINAVRSELGSRTSRTGVEVNP